VALTAKNSEIVACNITAILTFQPNYTIEYIYIIASESEFHAKSESIIYS
jgi:hypothetical protein